MAGLSLIQLFIVVFFLIFLVILLYTGCRRIYEIISTPDDKLREKIRAGRSRNLSSSSSTGSSGGSSVPGPRLSQTSNTSSIPGIHRIYLGADQLATTGGASPSTVYTIPISSLDPRRTSVVIIQPRTTVSTVPQAIIEEPPPSYDECITRVRTDPGDIV